MWHAAGDRGQRVSTFHAVNAMIGICIGGSGWSGTARCRPVFTGIAIASARLIIGGDRPTRGPIGRRVVDGDCDGERDGKNSRAFGESDLPPARPVGDTDLARTRRRDTGDPSDSPEPPKMVVGVELRSPTIVATSPGSTHTTNSRGNATACSPSPAAASPRATAGSGRAAAQRTALDACPLLGVSGCQVGAQRWPSSHAIAAAAFARASGPIALASSPLMNFAAATTSSKGAEVEVVSMVISRVLYVWGVGVELGVGLIVLVEGYGVVFQE